MTSAISMRDPMAGSADVDIYVAPFTRLPDPGHADAIRDWLRVLLTQAAAGRVCAVRPEAGSND
jgi:hypothetical protein